MKQDMRRIVREGYEKGDYPGIFRRNSAPNEIEKRFLDRLLSLCPDRPAILDLGCGTGVPVDKYLVARAANVVGVDISPKHIALANDSVGHLQFRPRQKRSDHHEIGRRALRLS